MSSQVSNTPRRELRARQAETIEKLLAAGDEELRAVGPEGLTIRTVAHRAGVSPATAYTYFSSRNHLFAELFHRALVANPPQISGATVVDRLQSVSSHMARMLGESPELAAAATLALLGTDPDVARLRVIIGTEFAHRFRDALGEAADPHVLEALVLAFSGALLQAGMGVMTYTEMGERLDSVVAVIMKGHP